MDREGDGVAPLGTGTSTGTGIGMRTGTGGGPAGNGDGAARGRGGWGARGGRARRVGTGVGARCRCPHSPAGRCPRPVPVSGAAGAAAAAGAGQEVTGAAPRVRSSGAGRGGPGTAGPCGHPMDRDTRGTRSPWTASVGVTEVTAAGGTGAMAASDTGVLLAGCHPRQCRPPVAPQGDPAHPLGRAFPRSHFGVSLYSGAPCVTLCPPSHVLGTPQQSPSWGDNNRTYLRGGGVSGGGAR